MPAPADPLAEIKRLYFAASKATIAGDLDRAIDLLKSMQDDNERERAAVFMDGLSQMRSEWGVGKGPAPKRGGPPAPAAKRRPAVRPGRRRPG